MDEIDIDLYNLEDVTDNSELSVVLRPDKEKEIVQNEPSSFKIVAVQSLAGNEKISQNFLSEINEELNTSEAPQDEIRPMLKIVPIASLKTPVEVTTSNENNLDESTNDEVINDDDGIPIKRYRIEKLGQTKLHNGLIENAISINDEIDIRPSGSSRRKSRITTRNADFDEPSVINNVIINAVREEQVQKARELPKGSKTELELMRNVAFLRVCVNHILMKIGRRPITYDRNNQTLASLIQKYSKS